MEGNDRCLLSLAILAPAEKAKKSYFQKFDNELTCSTSILWPDGTGHCYMYLDVDQKCFVSCDEK